jgi:acetoin utilization protein AcuB
VLPVKALVSGLLRFEGMSQRKSGVPVRQYPEVREYMSPAPHTIAPTSSLSKAVKAMREHQVRHLPVVEREHVVGVLSQRDILIMESLPGVNPTEVRVDEAMVRDVFTATPETPVGEVVETMLERKLGSTIVCEGERVLGVFTTTDALRALHDLLERP